MEKCTPNCTATGSQSEKETLIQWAQRLTSNNLILINKLNEIDQELAKLKTLVNELQNQLKGN